MTRLFVYGSLRSGAACNDLMGAATRLGPARTTAEYTLLRISWFPGLLDAGTTAVVGELYEVDATTLSRLDTFEGDGFYRGSVRLADGQAAGCWFVDPQVAADRPAIESGDFLRPDE